jgi:hypothetical protein
MQHKKSTLNHETVYYQLTIPLISVSIKQVSGFFCRVCFGNNKRRRLRIPPARQQQQQQGKGTLQNVHRVILWMNVVATAN